MTGQGVGAREIVGTVEAANGRGGVASAATTVTVTVVSGSVLVLVEPTTIAPNTIAPVPITIVNLGDVAITNLQADVSKAGGALQWQAGNAGSGWTCSASGGQIDITCLPADRTLAAGASTTFLPQVLTPASPDGQVWSSTVRVTGDGVDVEQPFDVTIRRPASADGSFSDAYLAV